MTEVRLGVIGCGGMARNHMSCFADIPRLTYTAGADLSEANRDIVKDTYGVTVFSDGMELLDSGLVDAVLIGTPHYFHPIYSMAAMERNIHVLTEKPVSVTAKAAAEVNAVRAAHPELKYAAMFQYRSLPHWRKAKSIIASGQLGEIKRVHMTCTDWLRTQAYFDSGSWRATWKGEGGGVLMNQCPHNLDVLTWLAGMPTAVQAKVGLGKYHNIEVEDDVSAIMEYENGATGIFVASTGEAPGTNYFEIVGDLGHLTLMPNFELCTFESSVDEFIRTTKGHGGRPPTTRMPLELSAYPNGGHQAIIGNFVDAILDGVDLLAPGEEGLHSVELANAMLYSGVREERVSLPMDRDAYDALLQELIDKNSTSA